MAPFKSTRITRAAIEAAAAFPDLAWFRIINGRLFIVNPPPADHRNWFRISRFAQLLNDLLSAASLPDVEFLINLLDEARLTAEPFSLQAQGPGSATSALRDIQQSYVSMFHYEQPAIDISTCNCSGPHLPLPQPTHFIPSPSATHPSLDADPLIPRNITQLVWPDGQALRVPIYSITKAPFRGHLDVLWPDFDFAGWNTVSEQVNRASSSRSSAWKRKDNVLFWRGSTTGTHIKTSQWKSVPRIKLVMRAGADDLIDRSDIRFVEIVQADAGAEHELTSYIHLAPRASLKDHLRHKWLLDIDGNSYSARLKSLLMSNSAVFKVETPFMEFFSSRLFPWKHYIPVSESLADLPGRLTWAAEHEAIVNTMALRSTEWIEANLRPEDVLCYMYRVLEEQHSLLDFSPTVGSASPLNPPASQAHPRILGIAWTVLTLMVVLGVLTVVRAVLYRPLQRRLSRRFKFVIGERDHRM